MRIVFMGTPHFAVPSLNALIAAGHDVACVYTQPPRPAGRGQREKGSPIHRAAEAHGLAVRTPRSLKAAPEQEAFAMLAADLAVVAAYGLILPKAVLAAPRLGCVNVHASLLPRWRGAAPIQRAILEGDTETGVCIMQMEEGLDTGPVFACRRVPIAESTTAGDLHDALAAAGATLLADTVERIARGSARATPQPGTGVTYAAKLDKAEAQIDWNEPAARVVRRVNAFSPAPGAWFALAGERIKVLRAALADGAGPSGVTLDDRLTVACGDGAVRLQVLQRAGKRAMETDAFLRGHDVPTGTRLA